MPEESNQLKAVSEAVAETYAGTTDVVGVAAAVASVCLAASGWWVWLRDKGDPFFWLLAAFASAGALATGMFLALVRARRAIHSEREAHAKEIEAISSRAAKEADDFAQRESQLQHQLSEKVEADPRPVIDKMLDLIDIGQNDILKAWDEFGSVSIEHALEWFHPWYKEVDTLFERHFPQHLAALRWENPHRGMDENSMVFHETKRTIGMLNKTLKAFAPKGPLNPLNEN